VIFVEAGTAARRIAIFDDHCALREMLRTTLCRHADYTVVGEGGTAREAVAVCLLVRPEIVILDLVLPDGNGVEVLGELRRQVRRLKVVFFSGCIQEQLVSQAIALGAAAFVSKTAPLSVLLSAVDQVAAGGKFFDPAIAHLTGRAATTREWQTLSGREREVVQLIAQGKSTKEAAVALGVSTKTLDKHRSHMMKKLRLHDAVAVTRYAIQAGLVVLN
jgi:DNA-binding NarL/FixJ family response regulator